MNSDDVIKKKRGRKSKNVVDTVLNDTNIEQSNIMSATAIDTDANAIDANAIDANANAIDANANAIDTSANAMDTSANANAMDTSANAIDTSANEIGANAIDTNAIDKDSSMSAEDVKAPKKRGRKPKGGKIIDNPMYEETNIIHEPNIILHLKCKFSDLDKDYLTYDCKGVYAFNFEKNKGSELGYHIIDNNLNSDNLMSNNNNICNNNNNSYNSENDIKSLCNKIKNISYNLQNNDITDKKSDCFWCTCSFDNPPIYIPKHKINNIYQCYGCFCSPECATAFLFKESIDTSTRFERYYLLNHIYNKVYEYTKNIKPAPDPFYTLNKYYGTLTIQEYRRLFKSERLLLVVDKPLSRVLPELHEYNDDIMLNENIQTTSKYTIKRKTKQKKTDILNEAFNMQ